MSEDKTKKVQNNSYIGIIVVISLVYIMILELVVKPKLLAGSGKFVSPIQTTYYDGIETDFVLCKDEITFNASSISSPIRYDEGTRLGYGEIKAGVADSSEYAVLSKNLQDIEDRISIYKNEINDIDKELRRSIVNENYSYANDLIGSFSYQNNDSVGKMNVEDLESERNNILSQINNNSGDIVWNPPGIISYSLDGFEDLKNESVFTTSRQEFKKILDRPILKNHSKDFKIIDNFKSTLMFNVPGNQKLMDLDGKYVKFSLDGYNTFGKGIVVVPADYQTEGTAGIVIDTHIEDIYQIRKGQINIIFDTLKSLVIPSKCIFRNEGKVGALVRNVNGVIDFRPVEILKTEGDKTYIYAGDNKGKVLDGEKSVLTVQYYEDVITNPSSDLIGKIFVRNEFKWLEVSMSIKENYEEVLKDIKEAAEKSGRNASDITLCAVTKTVDVDRINEALNLGVKDIGENKVQELTSKIKVLPKNINFHMIGQLQTNKVKYIINDVCLIHSLDRISLLKTLDKEAKKNDLNVDALIQINLTDDPNRGGVALYDLEDFVKEIKNYENVKVRGLMCVAHNTDDENIIRNDFRRMKLEFDRLKLYNISNVSSEILSMGMSHDYKIAIEEGATLVRVGTKIFGRR